MEKYEVSIINLNGCELEKISDGEYRYYYDSKENHSAWVTIKCSAAGWYYIRFNNVSQSANFNTLNDCVDNAYRDMLRAKL